METQNTQTTKRCTKCGQVKPIEEFSVGKNYADGHKSVCRKCQAEYNKQYYQKKAEDRKLSIQADPGSQADTPSALKVLLPKVEIRDGLKKRVNPLVGFSKEDLAEALRGRGVCVMIEPTARELLLKLKDLGYSGTLYVMEKRTIILDNLS